MHAHRSTPGSSATTAFAEVLPAVAYVLWALIGGSLALGFGLNGRNQVLVQLALGLLLLCAGLVASATRRALWQWLGRPALTTPTRGRLLALATLLPMLGVAGLARGSNEFWATRVLGAMLALACAANLLLAAARTARHRSQPPASGTLTLLTWIFCGGLWFRLCLLLEYGHDGSPLISPLLLVLMVLGLTSALSTPAPGRWTRLASALAFVVPCLLLALTSTPHARVTATAMAALSATCGICLHAALSRRWLAAPGSTAH